VITANQNKIKSTVISLWKRVHNVKIGSKHKEVTKWNIKAKYLSMQRILSNLLKEVMKILLLLL
jgi:hypothetical protein